MIWVLILGLHLAVQYSTLPARPMYWIGRTLLVLWVTSFTIMAAGLVGSLVRLYGSEVSAALPVTTLTQNVAQLAVVILGILVLLGLLGVPISAPLTALGVGGLAVALALQETLSNLFAGFYIAVAGQIRVGDYIKLNTGEEGYVIDISWRNTSIRVLANNLILIPNSKLAQAIVTNYYLPEKRMSVAIPVAVAYDSDPEKVERVLIETALEGTKEIPGLLPEPAPVARLIPGFGEFALNFTLGCHVAEFVDQYPVQHELRKGSSDGFARRDPDTLSQSHRLPG